MFSIIDDDIRISKGDSSGTFAAFLTDADGEPYVMQEGDTLKLRVKKRTTDDECLIELTADSEMQFEFLPQHTESLGCSTYKYQLLLKTAGDSNFRPIAVHDFTVEDVV